MSIKMKANPAAWNEEHDDPKIIVSASPPADVKSLTPMSDNAEPALAPRRWNELGGLI